MRLRKEYLYRKSLESKEAAVYDKKRQIREALEQGKSIPTELRGEEPKLREEMGWEDERTEVGEVAEEMDDEYAYAGSRDPKICVTTSRDPSSRQSRSAPTRLAASHVICRSSILHRSRSALPRPAVNHAK